MANQAKYRDATPSSDPAPPTERNPTIFSPPPLPSRPRLFAFKQYPTPDHPLGLQPPRQQVNDRDRRCDGELDLAPMALEAGGGVGGGEVEGVHAPMSC